MIKTVSRVVCCVVFLTVIVAEQSTSVAQVAPINPGYSTPANFSRLPTINFTERPGNSSDTRRLMAAIENANDRRTRLPGGGILQGARIVLRNGTYRLRGVRLQSNVHLRFGRDVILLADESSVAGVSDDEVAMFLLAGGIRNVSIVGNANSRRVRIFGPSIPSDPLEIARFRAITVSGVDNFLISNLIVNNRFSRFSTIAVLNDGISFAQRVDGAVPTRGTFTNITASNNSGSFGAIQVHAASRVRFRNIRSIGGVTLRLESGIANVHGIQDLSASEIFNTRGRTAVLFQPHAVRSHNRISILDAESTGSAFAVEFLNGFVSSRDRALNRPEFTRPGRFNNVSVRRVTANFGTPGDAQLRFAHFRFLPQSALPFLPNLNTFIRDFRVNGDTLPGTPLAAVLDEATDYRPRLARATVQSVGFPSRLSQRILTRATPDRNTRANDLVLGYEALLEAVEAMR